MTNWDQLDALGDAVSQKQREVIAKAQAQRDAYAAEQNAEIIRLLKEQEERTQQEQARLASLPQCPDCMGRVEVGARRCPQCRIDLVSHDFSEFGQTYRLICRASDAPRLLQQHIDSIADYARTLHQRCCEALAQLDHSWAARAQAACDSMQTHLQRYRPDSRAAASLLLSKALRGAPLATSSEEEQFIEMRQEQAFLFSAELHQELCETAQIAAKRAEDATRSHLLWIALLGFGVIWTCICILSAASAWLTSGSFGLKSDDLGLLLLGIVPAVMGICGTLLISGYRSSVRRAYEAITEFEAARDAAKAELLQRETAVHNEWLRRLDSRGLLRSVTEVRSALDKAAIALGVARAASGNLANALRGIACVLEFGKSLSIRLKTPFGTDSNNLNAAADRLFVPDMPSGRSGCANTTRDLLTRCAEESNKALSVLKSLGI